MKVFISHSSIDKAFASRLAEVLNANGISVWIDEMSLSLGDNIIQKIEEGIRSSDVIIAVLSKNYVSSKWAMQELSMFMARALSEESIRVFPALIEECDIPVFLRDRLYVDFRPDFDAAASRILQALQVREPLPAVQATPASRESAKRNSLELHSSKLSKHLRDGELTLVCGAGVSAAAGTPTWPVLLNELLSNLIRRKLPDGPPAAEDQKKLAQLYQEFFSPSALVVAQYLKNGLGVDFLETVRRTLYAQSPKSSELLDAMIDMCRPQRSRNSLNSIITFNFDDLIEHNLEENHIRHRAIYAEGQKANRSELPIYHVHGYLPHVGNIDETHAIVFSEDAYHTQFIDPFSWSNMVQLNHFGQTICLFVGLSMSDPNLRRLLDVAMRKNPERHANHYVFKKRNDPDVLGSKIAHLELAGNDVETAHEFVVMSEILEEQDSLNLGLNTIWIDDYSEIPPFLRALTTDP
jgi:hypothetical protein